jgi:D-alanyl-D-alanine carboxypeptidase
MTDLSQNQKLFASALAQSTGLNPNTVKAWLIAEEPAGAQSGYKGTQDWLNVGITDSGPQGAGNSVWKDPVSAGQATGNWIKGTWADPGFGKASPGIQSILKTVGKTPQEQLAAIAGSGWASSGYGGASRLQSLLSQVSGIGLPNVPAGGGAVASASPIPAPQFGSGTPAATGGPNIFNTLAGLEATRQKILGNNQPSILEKGWDALGNFLSGQQKADEAKQQATMNLLGPQPSVPGLQGNPSALTGKKGVVQFDNKPVAAWIAPILQWATAHGWKGSVSSGYRSYADQQRIYNSGVRPAAKPGTSNHEMTAFPGGAVDVTDAQQLSDILANSPYAGTLVWAGKKDPVHFSHPHNGGY